ncbi:hypothetical protein CPC08DRAFT_714634 [Agrocybe pediades]|nr:hypothetical protein CPC08DRAFT_714634 [Agrocybe pediades]
MLATSPQALGVEAYLGVQASRYAHLSAGVIILYDYATTFDQEVSLVWQGPLSIGKLLFISSRYYALFATIFDFYGLFSPPDSTSFCTKFYRWQGWTSIVVTMLAQGILQLRVYALYTKNRRVLMAMVTLFLLSISFAALIMGEILSELIVMVSPIPPLGRFCSIDTSKIMRISHVFWLPAIIFDTFLSVLAIIKSCKLRKSLANSVFRQTGEKLVDILFRDSAIYFFVITATYVTCMVIWIIDPRRLTELPLGFAVAFPCVVSNRMVLNLRGIRQRSHMQSGALGNATNYGTSPWFGFTVHRQEDTYLS